MEGGFWDWGYLRMKRWGGHAWTGAAFEGQGRLFVRGLLVHRRTMFLLKKNGEVDLLCVVLCLA